jgi:hypothetical protein
MFYINELEKNNHEKLQRHTNEKKLVHEFKNHVLEKLSKNKLIEYETKDLDEEYRKCKINSKLGRIKKKKKKILLYLINLKKDL